VNGGETVRLTIDDSGPGIPPDVLPRIFDPFFTTKDVGEGTGLGLAITYGIVQEHGGTIQASNTPRGGARFTIDLPAVRAAEAKSVRV
jgi:signal transduction histidine kinase